MYHYPRLSKIDFGFMRFGGPGLANCMFLAARAYVNALNDQGIFINPTWTKFSIGPYLRRERDKRVYHSIFRESGVHGIHKLALIILKILKLKQIKEYGPYDLGGYFTGLNAYSNQIIRYFSNITLPESLAELNNYDFEDVIGIHIRLGDYPTSWRTPLTWYDQLIKFILSINPTQKFILLSDGTNEELKSLLNYSNVKREFFGNAFADLTALSRCKLILGSDSTFSAWGAFLGRTPIVFAKRHFPCVFEGTVFEYVIPLTGNADNMEFPSELLNVIKNGAGQL